MGAINKEQIDASRPDRGISLLLAGAGTGKTSTLIEKVRNVISDLPLSPENALVLTFSRKAAEELRVRISAGLGGPACGVAAGTFHSYCLELLRRNDAVFRERFGYSDFPSVAGNEDKSAMLDSLIYPSLERFLGLPAGIVRELMMKVGSLDAWTARKLARAGIIDDLRGLAARYVMLKREGNIIDFDDMMDFAIRLLEGDPRIRAAEHDRFRYLFVDEFQDVSDDNFRLLKLLLPDAGGNLFAVGDDWQSIYGFRNARVGYTVRMKKYFPGASVRRLTVNYRSRKEIVSISNRFIRRNRIRTRKRLVSERGRGGIVRFHKVGSIDEETRLIRELISHRSTEADMAVLFRNNWQGRYIQERLPVVGLPDPKVSFMTMHGSKGLEFDTIIVAGIADGIIPDPDGDIEEERRLLYVAMTRARDELHVIAHINEAGAVGRFGRELGITGENISIR